MFLHGDLREHCSVRRQTIEPYNRTGTEQTLLSSWTHMPRHIPKTQVKKLKGRNMQQHRTHRKLLREVLALFLLAASISISLSYSSTRCITLARFLRQKSTSTTA